MPPVQIFDYLQPAAIMQRAGEFREPRTEAVGDSVDHPEADLRAALNGVLPAIRLFGTDAKDAADRLATHRGAVLFSVLPVGPRRHEPAPGLPIGEQRRSELADGLHVELAG